MCLYKCVYTVCIYAFVCLCMFLPEHNPEVALPSESSFYFDLALFYFKHHPSIPIIKCNHLSACFIHFFRHFLGLSSLHFLSLLPLSILCFPAHPIWSLTPHSCSSFNEHLSPSHARTCTHCSNTSHTKLPSKCLSVHACIVCDKAWTVVFMQTEPQHC